MSLREDYETLESVNDTKVKCQTCGNTAMWITKVERFHDDRFDYVDVYLDCETCQRSTTVLRLSSGKGSIWFNLSHLEPKSNLIAISPRALAEEEPGHGYRG